MNHEKNATHIRRSNVHFRVRIARMWVRGGASRGDTPLHTHCFWRNTHILWQFDWNRLPLPIQTIDKRDVHTII